MSATQFQKNLAFGQIAESEIAMYLRSRGNQILPVYDIEYETGKCPRLFGATLLVAPDLLVFKASKIYWAECKRKSVFSWYRKKSRWTTGIDLRHWNDYIAVSETTALPVWLLFLHCSDRPDIRDLQAGCPQKCPTGLFGRELKSLRSCVSHQSERWGTSGMIYWAYEDLKFIASVSEVKSAHIAAV